MGYKCDFKAKSVTDIKVTCETPVTCKPVLFVAKAPKYFTNQERLLNSFKWVCAQMRARFRFPKTNISLQFLVLIAPIVSSSNRK